MYSLPKLPYEFNALEPNIDAMTMEIHYSKHHQTYVDKLNQALENKPELSNKSIEELLMDVKSIDTTIRQSVINNGGGHFNHTLFWELLTPEGSSDPSSELKNAIDKSFGSFDEFKTKFKEAALSRFGSGWVWLIRNDNGLEIYSTPNQDSPIMEAKFPILGVDVWEHAYYLKYQNKRADYLDAIWNCINWDKVNERFIS